MLLEDVSYLSLTSTAEFDDEVGPLQVHRTLVCLFGCGALQGDVVVQIQHSVSDSVGDFGSALEVVIDPCLGPRPHNRFGELKQDDLVGSVIRCGPVLRDECFRKKTCGPGLELEEAACGMLSSFCAAALGGPSDASVMRTLCGGDLGPWDGVSSVTRRSLMLLRVLTMFMFVIMSLNSLTAFSAFFCFFRERVQELVDVIAFSLAARVHLVQLLENS